MTSQASISSVNKKTLYWICQLGGWGLLVFLLAVLNKLSGTAFNLELLLNFLTVFSLGVLLSHALRAMIIRLDWLRLNIPRIVPRVFIAAIVFGLVFHFLQSFISDVLIAGRGYEVKLLDIMQRTINWTVLCLLWSLCYFLFHFVRNYRKEEIKNLRWQAAKNEMELNKLKSQLNPHFIFNSMNTIRALISEDPEKAKNAVTQLSNILRNSLLMGKKKLIPFNEELMLVKDYLSLEKTRFEDRLEVKYQIDPASSHFQIPPLMVQTLVENGIKHGISNLPKGGLIQVSSSIEEGDLLISIKNSGKYLFEKQSATGFGLENTRQRLKLLYGDKGSFEIDNEDGYVVSTLRIPAETTELIETG